MPYSIVDNLKIKLITYSLKQHRRVSKVPFIMFQNTNQNKSLASNISTLSVS